LWSPVFEPFVNGIENLLVPEGYRCSAKGQHEDKRPILFPLGQGLVSMVEGV
jgi:hypothetical protein